MSNANRIVRSLLEDEPPIDTDALDNDVAGAIDKFGQDRADGKITSYTTANTFWHRTRTYGDGVRPLEVRRNGRTQTWKTCPGVFRIPCKYGMYEYFDITQNNADEFTSVRPPDKTKPAKIKQPKPVVNPSSLMPQS